MGFPFRLVTARETYVMVQGDLFFFFFPSPPVSNMHGCEKRIRKPDLNRL